MSANGWRVARTGLANYPLRSRPALVARRAFSRAFDAAGLVHPWVKHRPNPASPVLLDDFKVFAVLGTWMEADVVEATVKNAFTQGCERVFLLDNDSPDETVSVALNAGAELAGSFSTDKHEDGKRVRLMNEIVERVSLEDGSEHIWWLWLDADEFPHGPRGLTIREYLAGLDRSFRIVGSRYLNHYPAGEPGYVTGFHPLDFQPLAEELTERRCWLWHRKHQLQRFDRSGPPVVSCSGFHTASSQERPLLEPMDPIFVHHFPYRDREFTYRRNVALLGLDEQAPRGRYNEVDCPAMVARSLSLEAVYEGDWPAVTLDLAPGLRRPHVVPRPWTTIVEAEHHHVQRWYPPERLVEAAPFAASHVG